MKQKKIVFVVTVVLMCMLCLSFLCASGSKKKEAEVKVAEYPEPQAMPKMENASIDWKQFSGQEVSVLMCVHPWQEAIEPYIPEFEALTGMKVKLVKIPEAQFLTKVPADFTAGTFAFDVFMSQYYDSPKYALEHWSADIEPLISNAKITDAEWYDWNDFFPAARDVAIVGDTYFDRVALTAEAQILIYRDDIYQELGLSVPETFDELIENAKIINEKKDIAGMTLRGGLALWWPLTSFMRSYGGEYFDTDWTPLVNSKGSKEGAKVYIELTKYAPRGITSYDWDEINTAMLSGQAAMFLDSSVIYSRLQDPEKSTVVGKIKAAPYPKGPAGRIAHSHYWSISVAENSVKKEQAWMFIEWATSKRMMYRVGLKGVVAPRASVWEEPEFKNQFSPDFASALQETLKTAVISHAHTRFFEMMDILTGEMQKAILGEEDVNKALDFTQSEWEKIIADWKASL